MANENELITKALAALSDSELRAMHHTVLLLPKDVPDLLEWMDEAATWETERRLGESYPLRNLRDAIATNNFDATIAFTSSVTRRFRDDQQPEARAVAHLFAAINATLSQA
jgi:hypothetical protein